MWAGHVPRRVEQELLELPPHMFDSARQTLEQLHHDPHPPGCKKLKGRLQCWRVRIGAYRILYDIDPHQRTVVILKVGPRLARTSTAFFNSVRLS